MSVENTQGKTSDFQVWTHCPQSCGGGGRWGRNVQFEGVVSDHIACVSFFLCFDWPSFAVLANTF